MVPPLTMVAARDHRRKSAKELSFQARDRLEVVPHEPDNGWLKGIVLGGDGQVGYVRQELLEPASEPASTASPVVVGLEKETKNSATRYGMWATNMTIGCAMGLIGAGLVPFAWLYANAPLYSDRDLALGVYGIVVGTVVLLYESLWTTRSAVNFPKRAVAYALVAITGHASIVTLVPAAMLALSAAAHVVSAVRSERYERERRRPVVPVGEPDGKGALRRWLHLSDNEDSNATSKAVFLFVYGATNVAIFVWFLQFWFGTIDQQPANFSASHLVAWAKAWGTVLDFNCGMVLLPVCRTFIRYLYDMSTQTQTRSQRLFRRFLSFVPLDKALSFHKLVAWVILFASVMHTLAHLVNYGLAPDYTWQFYGIWPWVTGVGLFICMQFMYGAVVHNVKWFHFEVFWYTHHFFIGFYLLLLPHGRGGFNRNVVRWIAGSLLIYALEHLYRIRSAYKTVSLISITNMGDVIAVAFDRKSAFPAGYKEGQYLYLNVPHVSAGEWHPFTISSAPQEENVTLHIRIQGGVGGTSWTAKVADYLSLMMPPNLAFYSFVNPNDKSGVRGKTIGPDGKQIMRIYGPHSAPTQHISEYSVDLIIGAGIGVTPVCATLKSIVHYRWQFNIGRSYPDHAYFFFITSHKDLDSFRWFVRILKEADDEVHKLWATNPRHLLEKTFEFHIYVTSVPPATKPSPLLLISGPEENFWGTLRHHAPDGLNTVKAPWTEMQMLTTLKAPPKIPTRLGNVRIYNGRPEWNERFKAIALKHVANDIGVAYCGNPFVAKDLKAQCLKHSNTNSKTTFRLHKENF